MDNQDQSTAATPVTIGTVTVTEPITTADVLKSQGVVEAILPDGTRQQYSVEQAQDVINTQQAVVAALGGNQ